MWEGAIQEGFVIFTALWCEVLDLREFRFVTLFVKCGLSLLKLFYVYVLVSLCVWGCACEKTRWGVSILSQWDTGI